MKRILSAILLVLFAVVLMAEPTVTPTPSYEVVFFKVGIKKTAKTKSPNISESLYDICDVAWFEYDSKWAYCFAVIKTGKNKELISILNNLKPLTKTDENNHALQISIAQDMCDQMNGVKTKRSFP